jgi:hypothetical protein
MIGKRIESFIKINLEGKCIFPVVLVAKTHHNIVALVKGMSVIKVFKDIRALVVLFLEPVSHFRVFTLLLIDIPITFDDNSLSTK